MNNETTSNNTYNGCYVTLDGKTIYWSNYESYEYLLNFREEERKKNIRDNFMKKREELLKKTDFYFISDYINKNNKINYDILREYRQYLRDIPTKYDIYNDYIDFDTIEKNYNFVV